MGMSGRWVSWPSRVSPYIKLNVYITSTILPCSMHRPDTHILAVGGSSAATSEELKQLRTVSILYLIDDFMHQIITSLENPKQCC